MLRLKMQASAVPLAIAAQFARRGFLAGARCGIGFAGESVETGIFSWQAGHRCESRALPLQVAALRDPSTTTPVIYLSRDGPADHRFDAAVGVRDQGHRADAASLLD